MLTHEKSLRTKYFELAIVCARARHDWWLNCTTARTGPPMESYKRRVALRLSLLFIHLGCGNWRATSACSVFESRNERDWYAVVVVKDGVVAIRLSKAVSRILEEVQVLSKGIISLELISSFKNIRLINFRGFHQPTKIFLQPKISRLWYVQNHMLW